MPKEVWECQQIDYCEHALYLGGDNRYCQKPSLGCRYATCLTDEQKTASALAGIRKKLLEDLAEWIDVSTLAEAIIDGMESEEVKVTLEGAQKIWLSFLECELADALETRIDALVDNDEVKPIEEQETIPEKPTGPKGPLF